MGVQPTGTPASLGYQPSVLNKNCRGVSALHVWLTLQHTKTHCNALQHSAAGEPVKECGFPLPSAWNLHVFPTCISSANSLRYNLSIPKEKSAFHKISGSKRPQSSSGALARNFTKFSTFSFVLPAPLPSATFEFGVLLLPLVKVRCSGIWTHYILRCVVVGSCQAVPMVRQIDAHIYINAQKITFHKLWFNLEIMGLFPGKWNMKRRYTTDLLHCTSRTSVSCMCVYMCVCVRERARFVCVWA